jgi:hypothetical protein
MNHFNSADEELEVGYPRLNVALSGLWLHFSSISSIKSQASMQDQAINPAESPSYIDNCTILFQDPSPHIPIESVSTRTVCYLRSSSIAPIYQELRYEPKDDCITMPPTQEQSERHGLFRLHPSIYNVTSYNVEYASHL